MLSSLAHLRQSPLGVDLSPSILVIKTTAGVFCILSRVWVSFVSSFEFFGVEVVFSLVHQYKNDNILDKCGNHKRTAYGGHYPQAFFRKNGCAARHKTDNVGQHDRKYGHIESRRGKLAEQLGLTGARSPF